MKKTGRYVSILLFAIMAILAWNTESTGAVKTAQAQDLSDAFTGTVSGTNTAANSKYTYQNPFQGKDTSKGVEISFRVNSQTREYALGAVFAIITEGGLQYFTPGSYLGYNGAGGWYDANLTKDYTMVKNYMKAGSILKIRLFPGGFGVYVDDVLCYDQSILSDSVRGRFENITGAENGLYQKALETLSKEGYLQFGFGSWWNEYGWDEADLDISNAVFQLADGTVLGNYFMEQGESEPLYHSEEEVPVTGISLDQRTIYLNGSGDTAYAGVNITPFHASNQEVTWGSSGNKIIRIDKNGKMTALQNGTVHVHVFSKDGGYRSNKITVIVSGCDETEGTLLVNKNKFQLTVGKKGKIRASASGDVSFRSLKKKIATVSSKGVIKAKAAGKAIIVVQCGNAKKKIRVTVKNAGLSVKLGKDMKFLKNSISIKKGKKLTIQKTSGLSGKVTFRSLDKKVASVSVNGVVKARQRGKTAILATNGKKTAKLTITVRR